MPPTEPQIETTIDPAVFAYLRDNLRIELRSSAYGCPEEGTRDASLRVVILLRDPETGEDVEIGSNDLNLD